MPRKNGISTSHISSRLRKYAPKNAHVSAENNPSCGVRKLL
jgi:hypothetical protein